ncbi:MAG: hypothetical protein A2Z21_05665 [Candidatus Fraserbacteria bacterium RBG_16_55_9]|uniref:Polyhydroxybutyrate depolymerase n=1 Tax=Fraserbacteria sp. (strain RBG_16_55_9) TaxID=1817864 RepID=A0A1F5UPN6_FRAXR|nr:MAG: hypothetical protein A2Z21_05665 [Candidatus Fraserbacteria bacterium RBG_16_55_9]
MILKTRWAILFALIALWALFSCTAWVRSQSPEHGQLIFEGRTRTYILHLPPVYNGQDPLPLVIFLHGGGGNAEGAVSAYGLSNLADREGFIVVYPNGTGVFEERLLTWNSGHCCGYALNNRVYDAGFIRSLIEKLQRELKIDPKRIYATGHSNGGMLSYRLGGELSDVLAAIAPVAGTIGGQVTPNTLLIMVPQPKNSIAVIAFHGKLDSHVLYNGGHGAGTSGERVDLSVAESITFWVNANRCSPIPQAEVSTSGNIIRDTYRSCANGADVALYTVLNGGHSWPGTNQGEGQTHEISATELLWEFFKEHPKP